MHKILIVDDIEVNRKLLRQTLLTIDDYNIIEAAGGKDAIEQYKNEKPDLILMDVMMPEIDGCQATAIIKENMGSDYTPVIFVTALNEAASLVDALEAGGDDYISKPFNIDVLTSKVKASLRVRELTQQINKQNHQLSRLNQHLKDEHELIDYFFESAIQQSFLDEKIIQYHMSSLSTFNGDILFVERGPEGGLYLIIGDFSGHGLTAAMGTLPVAMIFFKMVSSSAAVSDIAREINRQLYKLMPSRMFFAATLIELSAQGNILSVWMGGMPEMYCMSSKGQVKEIIHSQHMPLGILNDDEFDAATQIVSIEENDKIYLYSDGVIEATNDKGELFGDERLSRILTSGKSDYFDNILNELKQFTGTTNQDDDITLVELTCSELPAVEMPEPVVDGGWLPWQISISLSTDDMRSLDPVGKVSEILNAMPAMARHKGVLHILLSEMYSNALDHSILGLESQTKCDEENFLDYYVNRDEQLLNLQGAQIDFAFRFIAEKDNNNLYIKITDNGKGFQGKDTVSDDDVLHGRGLSIIETFCDQVTFNDDGKSLEVCYRL